MTYLPLLPGGRLGSRLSDDLIQAGLFLAFCLLLLFLAAGAQANALPDGPTCPLTHSECLPRDLHADITRAGAEPWEIGAIEAVASGRQGRDMVTLTEAGQCGGAGFLSLTPGREGLGLSWEGHCAWDDPQWRDNTLAWLYSDASGGIQLAAFRRISGRAIAEAHRAGMPRPLAAIMANSAPNAFVRAGRARGWDRVEILKWYVSQGDPERRLHRVERWL